MPCDQGGITSSGGGSDRLEGGGIARHFDGSSTAWLIGEAVRYLNLEGKEAELAYKRTVELLVRCADLVKATAGLLGRIPAGDAPLRWSLLHILGDAGNASAADLLVHAALDRLPSAQSPGEGCEGARDMEMLVRTMAVVALHRVASRHSDVARDVLKIVSSRPAQPILIEAVRAGWALGLGEQLRELLPKDDQWMLDIRHARPDELFVDPEREDGKERGFTPPKFGQLYTAPRAGSCDRKKEG